MAGCRISCLSHQSRWPEAMAVVLGTKKGSTFDDPTLLLTFGNRKQGCGPLPNIAAHKVITISGRMKRSSLHPAKSIINETESSQPPVGNKN
jgi:hypothetical protein